MLLLMVPALMAAAIEMNWRVEDQEPIPARVSLPTCTTTVLKDADAMAQAIKVFSENPVRSDTGLTPMNALKTSRDKYLRARQSCK
jgi:hypothetical protein